MIITVDDNINKNRYISLYLKMYFFPNFKIWPKWIKKEICLKISHLFIENSEKFINLILKRISKVGKKVIFSNLSYKYK